MVRRMNVSRLLVCLVLVACKGNNVSQSSPSQTADAGLLATPTRTAAAQTAQTAPSVGPLDLDEARYQKWVSCQKEINPALQKGITKTLQPIANKKEETVVGAAADLHTAGANLDEMKKQLDAIRSKYGFSEAEDNRVWEALGDVMAGDNAMVKPMIDQMKQMAQTEGPGKEAAVKFLKDQADQDQKRLAKARERFGDKAIDVLLAHRPELLPLFNDHTAAALSYTGNK